MATSLALGLDTAMRAAGIPIHGVSIGDPAVPATWIVHFAPEATGPQQTQAAQILVTFDPNDPVVLHDERHESARLSPDTDALIEWLGQYLALPSARIRRDVRTLLSRRLL